LGLAKVTVVKIVGKICRYALCSGVAAYISPIMVLDRNV